MAAVGPSKPPRSPGERPGQPRAQHEGRAGQWALRLRSLRAWPGEVGRLCTWLVLEQARPGQGGVSRSGHWKRQVREAAPNLRGPGGWAGCRLGSRENRLERVPQGALCAPSSPPFTLPTNHPPQNDSRELLGEALAQHIRQKIDARGDHQLSHYNLDGTQSHGMGTAHVSVLGEDGSAVAATSTINTPCVHVPCRPQTGPTHSFAS